MQAAPAADNTSFIARWKSSGAAERANYQLFLSDLCDLLGFARPDPSKPAAKLAWPILLAEQAQAIRAAIATVAVPADAALVASQFKGARADGIEDLLETLASLGQARVLPDSKYVGA